MHPDFKVPDGVPEPDEIRCVEDLIIYVWKELDGRVYGRLHRYYLKNQNTVYCMPHPHTGIEMLVEMDGPRARVPEGTMGPDYHKFIFHVVGEAYS